MKQAVNSSERLTYTVPEVARLLGINTITAYYLARREDFPAVRIGKRIIIPKVALERWLDRQSGAGAER
ncbi:MAG: helix-turn-helix domain-containing protein [Clostridia bacterium]|nr:helix-turn-helix domain-containing protein [Clostridia bacterium]